MADDTATQETLEGETPPEDKTPETGAPSLSDLPPAVANALEAERKRASALERKNKEQAKRLEEFANEGKSEMERLTGERDGLKTENATLADRVRRLSVALDKQLPPDLVARLQGDTDEEMAADADQLLKLVQPPQPGRGSFDEGARAEVSDEEALTPEQQHQKFLANLLNPTQ